MNWDVQPLICRPLVWIMGHDGLGCWTASVWPARPTEWKHRQGHFADRGCPETMSCCEQEEHQAGSVADTPYAQVPPLPPWMADLGAGGAAAQLPGSSAAAAPGVRPIPIDSLDQETRSRVLELLDQTQESNANFLAQRQRAARVHAETQAQLARFRAAMQSGQQLIDPINADALSQAAATAEAQLACLRAEQGSQQLTDAEMLSRMEADIARLRAGRGGQQMTDADSRNRLEADRARLLRAGRGGQHPIGADALNQALGEPPSVHALLLSHAWITVYAVHKHPKGADALTQALA